MMKIALAPVVTLDAAIETAATLPKSFTAFFSFSFPIEAMVALQYKQAKIILKMRLHIIIR